MLQTFAIIKCFNPANLKSAPPHATLRCATADCDRSLPLRQLPASFVSTRNTPSCAPSRNASFTIRSSSEWKLMITSLPPFFRTCGAASALSSVSQVVKFTVHQNSESLKGLCRRMNAPLSLVHWPGRSRYDLRKLCGGGESAAPEQWLWRFSATSFPHRIRKSHRQARARRSGLPLVRRSAPTAYSSAYPGAHPPEN